MKSTPLESRVILCVLWILLVVGMMLHFDYHVSGIFYGIDVKRPNATGTFPWTLALIRFVFQIAPLCYITFILFFTQKWLKAFIFSVSLLYTAANAWHLTGEFRDARVDISQINLLSFVLAASILLNLTAWRWFKESNIAITETE